MVKNSNISIIESDSTLNLIQEKSYTKFKDSKIRFLLLAFVSLTCIGAYYCFDIPQALEVYIKDELNINNSKYNLLYSIFSIPNIIIPFISSFIIIKIGDRLSIIILSMLLIIGQSIILVGGINRIFSFMLLGRIFFGIGSVTLFVAQVNKILK